MADLGLDIIEIAGFVAAGLVFLTFCMKTMIALRLVAIASNLAFIYYAYSAGLTPILILHLLLLPLNLFRLIQLELLVRRARKSVADPDADRNQFEWLIPIGRQRRLADGEQLFAKGDDGRSMFIVVDGHVRLPEIDVRLGRNEILGEISLFTGDGKRGTSAVADGEVRLSELTERQVRELYFDNPALADALLQIVARRLTENLGREARRPQDPQMRDPG